MRFEIEQNLSRLVVDITEVGVLGKHEDAKYYWFKQSGNDWEPVESVTRFVKRERGIGLLKSTSLKIALDGNEFRTSDLISIQGKIGLRYKVIHPGKLIEYHDNLSQQTLDVVSSVLNDELLLATTSGDFRKQLPEVKVQANKNLNTAVAYLGIELSIVNLELSIKHEQIIENTSVTDLDIQSNIALEGRRNQLDDIKQKQQLQWEVNRLLSLGEAGAQIERESIDNIAYKMKQLMPPNADPYLLMAYLLADKDPAAGEVIAKLVDTQGQYMMQAKKADILAAYLESKAKNRGLPPGTVPRFSPPILDDQPPLQSPADPIIQAIQDEFPSVIRCPLPAESSGGKEYTVAFQNLVISFVVRPNGLSRVQYGTNRATTTWSGGVPEGNSPTDVVRLVSTIKNSVDKRQRK